MIGRLTGVIAEKSPPRVLIDVNGVGYEVDVPMSSYFPLPATGQRTTLHIHTVVREDAFLLYGFLTLDERRAFRELLKISGVGARIGLAVLSGLSVVELVQAVALQEPARLVRVPGIGKKTAERLLLELKGKLGDAVVGDAPASGEASSSDIVAALEALGYSDREALAAVRALPAGTGVSDGIKLALKSLAR